MELKIIEQSKKKLVFEVHGESHTLCNALKEELRNDKKVTVVSYFVSHPDIDEPTFILETSGAVPKKCLLDAVNRLKKENDKFLKIAAKEIK